jgi:hypothetical protein
MGGMLSAKRALLQRPHQTLHAELAHVAERHRWDGEAPRLDRIYFLLRFQNGGSSIVHLYVFVWVSLHAG